MQENKKKTLAEVADDALDKREVDTLVVIRPNGVREILIRGKDCASRILPTYQVSFTRTGDPVIAYSGGQQVDGRKLAYFIAWNLLRGAAGDLPTGATELLKSKLIDELKFNPKSL